MRNKVNAGEQQMSSAVVIRGVLTFAAGQPDSARPRAESNTVANLKWSAPATSCLKINFDGAFCPTSKEGAWGFLIRDDTGACLLAGAGNEGPVYDALMAEAIACLKSLEVAEQHGISQLIIETDSTQMMDAIRTNSRDLSPSGMLFKAIRDLFLDTFTNSNLVYAPRSCNSAAHAAAQFARSRDPGHLHVWTDSFPNCVNVAVARDSAELVILNARP